MKKIAASLSLAAIMVASWPTHAMTWASPWVEQPGLRASWESPFFSRPRIWTTWFRVPGISARASFPPRLELVRAPVDAPRRAITHIELIGTPPKHAGVPSSLPATGGPALPLSSVASGSGPTGRVDALTGLPIIGPDQSGVGVLITPPPSAVTVNVQSLGAKGDGVHDDTAAIQAAVDSLPAGGGTVYVPPGRYMVNALKPIMMRSHSHLVLDDLAALSVLPNASERYYVIKVWNVEDVTIKGGQIVGDRVDHQGSTGEWGYGINISGSKHVKVDGVHISNCWGDGIWVGALGSVDKGNLNRSDDVTITRVVSDNNRRQGMSIGPAQNVWITDSTFSNTNGTLPMAGIDIEPMSQGPTNTIHLVNNVMTGNQGNGIEIHAHVSDLDIRGNQLVDNHGYGLLSVNGNGYAIDHNTMSRNGLAGLGLNGPTDDVLATANTITYNSTRYISPSKPGGGSDRDLQIKSTGTNIVIASDNVFTPKS